MPRDEAEYSHMLAEFQARHGKVTIKRTSGPKARKAPKPTAEDIFAQAWESARGVPPVRQYRFHDTRKWTFDFAWPAQKLALEIEGFGAGGFGGGHHNVPGALKDAEKFAEAVIMGWRVLRVPARGGRDAKQWVELVTRALKA